MNTFVRIEEEGEGNNDVRLVAIINNEIDAQRIVQAVNATPWSPPRPKSANGFTVGDRVRLKDPKGTMNRLMTVDEPDVGAEHKVKVSWLDMLSQKKIFAEFFPLQLNKVVAPPMPPRPGSPPL